MRVLWGGYGDLWRHRALIGSDKPLTERAAALRNLTQSGQG